MIEGQKISNVSACECGCTKRLFRRMSDLDGFAELACFGCGGLSLVLAEQLPRDPVAILKARHLFDVVARIAAQHHVTVEQIMGKKRLRNVSHARHHAWEMLRRPPFKLSYPEIADIWGGLNHTSVMYGVHKVAGRPPKQLDLLEVA